MLGNGLFLKSVFSRESFFDSFSCFEGRIYRKYAPRLRGAVAVIFFLSHVNLTLVELTCFPLGAVKRSLCIWSRGRVGEDSCV